MKKHELDIDLVMDRVREAVKPFPKAALFELADQGFRSMFELLVACIISIRTRDEETLLCARELFEKARTAAEMSRLSAVQVDEAINRSAFHENKASQIVEIARLTVEKHAGSIPCSVEALTSFRGVGPKCAHLVLGIACGQPRIGVDTHVHRVTNRWGYVKTHTPEQTMRSLEEKLPVKYWIEINRLLVPFGKHICTPSRPKCSTCPVLDMCLQVGVGKHR